MKNGDFTKRKFLSFSLENQHKQCAELLRIAYEKSILGHSTDEEMEAYHILIDWMEYPKMSMPSLKIISDTYHQHIRLANVKHKEHNLLPSIRKGDRPTAKNSWNIAIYLDNIRSAHNVGSILRTIESFSLGQVYFSENTPFSDNKQVQDTAMGADKWVKCHKNIKLTELASPIIALETSDSALSLFEYIFPENFTLVVGNEEYGCSEKTLEIADIIIEIPLRGHKNSLNVANAFAIAAGEICRQKTLRQIEKIL